MKGSLNVFPRPMLKRIRFTPASTGIPLYQCPYQIHQTPNLSTRSYSNGVQIPLKTYKSRSLSNNINKPFNQHPIHFYSMNALPKEPTVHDIFEPVTGTWQYIVADPSTQAAVIIDPVLNYEPATQTITTTAADALLALVQERGYQIERIIETHAHADHLTASAYLQHQLNQIQGSNPPIGIGKRITQVQNLFGHRYQIGKREYEQVFDHLFDDDESFTIGEMTATALHLPGHTPDHLGYKIGGTYSATHT